MKAFMEHNESLEETMNTHLIDDLDAFGIWDDDYDKFFDMRAEKISNELSKRIIPNTKMIKS